MVKNLIELQKKLAKRVIIEDKFAEIKQIAGADQAFFGKDIVCSCVVVLDYKNLELIEKAFSHVYVNFPYIPGFLSFREAPSIVEAYKKIKNKVDVLLIDGNGILHPRRIGLASYVGLLFDIPTIGVAKSLLCGYIKNNKVIVDNEERAYVLYSKEGCNPIYISPGHKISLESSIKIVKECIKKHKLPEPIYLAHKWANFLL